MSSGVDLAIIGGGPAGYVAALRAAQLGARTVLVEREHIGGVCLNWGCIPTKTLLRSAAVLDLVRRAHAFGVLTEGERLDWPTVQGRRREVVDRLVGGVRRLLDRAGVSVVEGTGRLVSPHEIEVARAGEVVERISSRRVLLATGSAAAALPVPGLEGPAVLDCRDALGLDALPQSVAVVGGGAVGVEFATLFSLCGVDVTLIEMLPHLLPALDRDLGQAVGWVLQEQGVSVRVGARVTECQGGRAGCRLAFASEEGEGQVEVEKVLLAVGRRPNVEGLGLEGAGVRYEKAGIAVDGSMSTSVPGVYAAGDVTGCLMLAHVAYHQGVVAVENALGGAARTYRPDAVPKCVFARPEVASVGLSEEEARRQGYEVRVGRFSLTNSGMALSLGEEVGFVKVVAEARLRQVLGLHIVGAHASDLILEGAMALTLEATLDEFGETVHPHPTLGEAIAEAALAAEGRALHAL